MRARVFVSHLLRSQERKRAECWRRGKSPWAQSPLTTSSEANDGLGQDQVLWVEKCPPPLPPHHVHLEPQNVTLFGERVFADGIR